MVWHVPGDDPLAGEIHGREALFRWFDRLRHVTEGTFALVEHDVLGTNDHVVALSGMSAIRGGVRISVSVVSVFHFRDGRQQERWFHPSDLVAGTGCSAPRCNELTFARHIRESRANVGPPHA